MCIRDRLRGDLVALASVWVGICPSLSVSNFEQFPVSPLRGDYPPSSGLPEKRVRHHESACKTDIQTLNHQGIQI
eukprot:1815370-Alexandrium_andersonii.AAC.1